MKNSDNKFIVSAPYTLPPRYKQDGKFGPGYFICHHCCEILVKPRFAPCGRSHAYCETCLPSMYQDNGTFFCLLCCDFVENTRKELSFGYFEEEICSQLRSTRRQGRDDGDIICYHYIQPHDENSICGHCNAKFCSWCSIAHMKKWLKELFEKKEFEKEALVNLYEKLNDPNYCSGATADNFLSVWQQQMERVPTLLHPLFDDKKKALLSAMKCSKKGSDINVEEAEKVISMTLADCQKWCGSISLRDFTNLFTTYTKMVEEMAESKEIGQVNLSMISSAIDEFLNQWLKMTETLNKTVANAYEVTPPSSPKASKMPVKEKSSNNSTPTVETPKQPPTPVSKSPVQPKTKPAMLTPAGQLTPEPTPVKPKPTQKEAAAKGKEEVATRKRQANPATFAPCRKTTRMKTRKTRSKEELEQLVTEPVPESEPVTAEISNKIDKVGLNAQSMPPLEYTVNEQQQKRAQPKQLDSHKKTKQQQKPPKEDEKSQQLPQPQYEQPQPQVEQPQQQVQNMQPPQPVTCEPMVISG